MNRLLKAASISAIVGVVFVALQLVWALQTGLAGLFVIGMASGFMLAHRIVKVPAPAPAA